MALEGVNTTWDFHQIYKHNDQHSELYSHIALRLPTSNILHPLHLILLYLFWLNWILHNEGKVLKSEVLRKL